MILQDLKTKCQHVAIDVPKKGLTREVSTDSRLHQGLHPFSNDELFIVAEVMRLVGVMYESEPIPARVNVFIGNYSIAKDIDIAFDLRFLQHGVNT